VSSQSRNYQKRSDVSRAINIRSDMSFGGKTMKRRKRIKGKCERHRRKDK
jgi:hypothetical protein